MNDNVRYVALLLIIVVLALCVGTFVVRAHTDGQMEYDWECCHNHDCAPVDKMEPDGDNGTWFTSKFGRVLVPRDFPKENMKVSKDERWHICIVAGKPRCVYYPAQY